MKQGNIITMLKKQLKKQNKSPKKQGKKTRGKKKWQQLSKEDAQRLHSYRNMAAITRDNKTDNKKYNKTTKWALNPGKYDYPDVDTPEQDFNPWMAKRESKRRDAKEIKKKITMARKRKEQINKETMDERPDFRKNSFDKLHKYKLRLLVNKNKLREEKVKIKIEYPKITDKKDKEKAKKLMDEIDRKISAYETEELRTKAKLSKLIEKVY